MSNCIAPGWGTGAWGQQPWAGSLVAGVGGPLPIELPFDVYCLGPCGPISAILTHPEVTTIGDPTQFPVDMTVLDQDLASGGAFLTSDAAFFINKAVPEDFTLEFTAQWGHLPPDFTDLSNKHSFFGASSSGAGCVGLFFSQVGIAYTGSVHFDGSDNLVLDTAVQDLPNSQTLVSENEYWTVRIAMSFSTRVVYIYVTKTSELLTIGHQLRYIMPAIPSATAAVVPPNETVVSVRGTVSAPTFVGLDSLCLGTGLIIPNIIPLADGGLDQAIRTCSILQLDGTKSIDPQGGNLIYKWRLLEAPPGSQYIYDEADGLTVPGSPPTGFTDRLYSASLETLNGISAIPTGSVIVLQGQPYNILTTGTDISGFFVRVDGFVLPDNLSSPTAFKYVLQNGLNTASSPKPTFYPDVPGIFKFDLAVFNGALFSAPAVVVVNVTESVVARGVTPDVTFLWNYLTDFWRLVEDKDRIEVFWQGLAQVAAAELLNLWQIDYSKSLRDVQRTFQRRWLHYDMLMQEDPNLVELSTVRAVFGGLGSSSIPTAGISGVHGTHLDLQFTTMSDPVIITFQPADPVTAAQLQTIIQATVAQLDPRVAVQVLEARDGTSATLRIDAPFAITVLPSSTATFFTSGASTQVPNGTAGMAIGVNTYRVERSLLALDIQENDFLCVDGVAYRIARIADDPSDPLLFQRLTLLDTLPIPAGAVWSIAGTVHSLDLNFWDGLVEQDDEVTFEIIRLSDQGMGETTVRVLGASAALPSSLPIDTAVLGVFLAQPAFYSVFLKNVLRRKYIPCDPLVVDVPLLQENIVSKDDTQVLRRNVDYFFDTFRGQNCIRFVTPVPQAGGGADVWQGESPPDRMWAETTYLDNRPRIEGNFGIPAAFTLDDLSQLPNNVDYLSAVRGLWYAYFNGPTVFNLRAGVQILLGLPFAEEAGTIVEIRNDFSTTTGRILVQDLADTTTIRSYSFPALLPIETNPATGKPYVVGDTAKQFAPLVGGVEVLDYVKNPKWFAGYLEQGSFFEVEKFFKFLVRVDSAAFNLQSLLFVKSFILRIKPTYTYPLFVVLVTIGNTEVTATTLLQKHGTLHLNAGVCYQGLSFGQTLGVSTMFDQPRPGGGGWRSQFDHNANPATPPTYPTPNAPIAWGYDRMYLCPEDAIMGTICTTYLAPTMPMFDSIFQFDEDVYTSEEGMFADGLVEDVPASLPGLPVGGIHTVAVNATLNRIGLFIQASDVGNPNTYHLVIQKNGTDAVTVAFTLTAAGYQLDQAISLPVIIGDSLTCFIRSTVAGVSIEVLWTGVLVTVGQAVAWAFDTLLPAGTYCSYRDL